MDTYIFYTASDDLNIIKKWVNREFNYVQQKGENLGEKMSNAFEYLFEQKYSNVVIVGSDIPDLSVDVIKDAFEYLENNEIVISPSDDGGYSLLGMNKYYPSLFMNIEWSTSTVLDSTINIIRNQGAKLHLTNELKDIDTEKELKNWISNSKNYDLIERVNLIAKQESITL